MLITCSLWLLRKRWQTGQQPSETAACFPALSPGFHCYWALCSQQRRIPTLLVYQKTHFTWSFGVISLFFGWIIIFWLNRIKTFLHGENHPSFNHCNQVGCKRKWRGDHTLSRNIEKSARTLCQIFYMFSYKLFQTKTFGWKARERDWKHGLQFDWPSKSTFLHSASNLISVNHGQDP